MQTPTNKTQNSAKASSNSTTHTDTSWSNSDIDLMFPPAQACFPEYSHHHLRQQQPHNHHHYQYYQHYGKNSNTQYSQLIKDYHLARKQSSVTLPSSTSIPTQRLATANYPQIKLNMINCQIEEICSEPAWSVLEVSQHRRIVRFTKSLENSDKSPFEMILNLTAQPVELLESDLSVKPYGIDQASKLQYLEVSCIRCTYQPNNLNLGLSFKYYMTSVEIIKLIQFIIGTLDISNDYALRIERGRLRSNLLPFWSNWKIKSKNTLNPAQSQHSSESVNFPVFSNSTYPESTLSPLSSPLSLPSSLPSSSPSSSPSPSSSSPSSPSSSSSSSSSLLLLSTTSIPLTTAKTEGEQQQQQQQQKQQKQEKQRQKQNQKQKQKHPPNELINELYRSKLSDVIINYKFRKPRGFEKTIRVISWDKIQPALERVLLNYCYLAPPQPQLQPQFPLPPPSECRPPLAPE